MKVLLKLTILIVAIYVASYIIPGVKINSTQSLFVVAVLLGVINAVVKPILIVLTLPLTILTLGLFLLFLNGILILVLSSIVPGFFVSGIFTAILFSLVVSIVSSVLNNLI